MADYFACKIEIGGKLTTVQVEKIVEICKQHGRGFGWGDAAPTVDEIVETIEAGEELVICDDQARYGEMPDLEGYLVEEGIPFIEQQDGRYEFDAKTIWFNGKETVSFPSNQSGNQLVETQVVREALALIDDGKLEDGLNLLRSRSVEPKLPAVSLKP